MKWSENEVLCQDAQSFTERLSAALRMSACVGKTWLMCIPCCSLHCQCVASALYNYVTSTLPPSYWQGNSVRSCHCQANRLQQSSTRTHRHIKPTLAGAVKLTESLIELIESIGGVGMGRGKQRGGEENKRKLTQAAELRERERERWGSREKRRSPGSWPIQAESKIRRMSEGGRGGPRGAARKWEGKGGEEKGSVSIKRMQTRTK